VIDSICSAAMPPPLRFREHPTRCRLGAPYSRSYGALSLPSRRLALPLPLPPDAVGTPAAIHSHRAMMNEPRSLMVWRAGGRASVNVTVGGTRVYSQHVPTFTVSLAGCLAATRR